MDDPALLVDLHVDGDRQGPGGEAETRLSVALSGLVGRTGLNVADIGCGTGASTLVLADALDARITAVDFLPAFLEKLAEAARAAGVAERITPLEASMEALTFAPGSLDAIWSEGAIYNMGFEAGVEAWRGFLKRGGILAVSELTWLTDRRPDALEAHWRAQYPQVDTASAKMAVLERLGFTPLGYFPLPDRCWMETYYAPMRRRFPDFLARHGDAPAARAIVEAEETEIALWERWRAHFGYGYYIARKVRD
ncbi:class I SAM-dependent methyltransferase [Salinarimonas sp. NSM]|uniref:class I SAM-dependent methyltransferase n=1 Tax=Salinarimonas sp. NSM TaxID=3458003 RepID=UPI0040367B5C